VPDVDNLISGEEYFVLYAPCQSGKTTSMKAYVNSINAEGRYYALYCNLETVSGNPELATALAAIVGVVKKSLSESEVEELRASWRRLPPFDHSNPYGRPGAEPPADESPDRPPLITPTVIIGTLQALCKGLSKELVIFFDEADCLSGEILISFLRQLRAGYMDMDTIPFPRSIALIGLRNIRDYKAQVRPDLETLGTGSPFNIITEALTLANFTLSEVGSLYAQHTEAARQRFEPEAVERVMFWTDGQPWLVNALAREVVEKILKWDYSRPVTLELIDQAAEAIKLSRSTHIDSLMARLHEPRVRRIMEPVLSGSELGDGIDDDLDYCLEIGLIKKREGDIYAPANLIYADVMVRTLTRDVQRIIPKEFEGRFIGPDGLDITGLLKSFQDYWAVNSDAMSNRISYKQCDAQFSLHGYLQRVFNGRVQMIKECATGGGRVDICAVFQDRRYPIELKMRSSGRSKAERLAQILRYMDVCRAQEGWLVVFDRDSKKPWSKKLTWRTETLPGDLTVHTVGC
jgi:hypothetical protein